jgi:hypothetical protein
MTRQAVEETRRAFVATADLHADHAAEAAHLPARDLVVGVRRQTG